MEDNILVAKHVYILMKKGYRISRNIRAEWYLERINSCITISRKSNINDFDGELEVVSVLPEDPPQEWDSDTAHEYQYLITDKTKLHFIARKYRIVFCLDLSPSFSTVNIENGQVICDQIFSTLEKCLKGIVRPFYVPGSQLLFYPKIYLTIVAHTPFKRAQAHQVLIQGWLLMSEEKNLAYFLKLIQEKLIKLQKQLAKLTSETYRQTNPDCIYHCIPPKVLCEEANHDSHTCWPSSTEMCKFMVSPDIGFVDLLRYGIISLQLLPEDSIAGIIVITDGVISLPDATIFDSLLVQLRNLTISCSFLQLGSSYFPSSSLGYIPFNDLMQFLAKATFGVHLTELPIVNLDYQNEMNDYHKSFLTWEFQKGFQEDNEYSKSFCSLMVFEPEIPVMVRKREWTSPLMVTLPALLSCRLREGYTIKHVSIAKEQIILILVLPWKYSISIEYHIHCPWPFNTSNSLQTEVWIEASYEFLEDVSQNTASSIHQQSHHQIARSLYRKRMVDKYWSTLQDLGETDLRLASLQSFASCPAHYVLPDCFKRGHPVFFINPQSNLPTPSNEGQFSEFYNFWRPISMLNVLKWQKWMHIHRIGVILQHDPSILNNANLHTTSSSGRYGLVDTRQADVLLMSLLAEWSDFTLIESHSYAKFLYSGCADEPPSSFFMVRITSKRPPCLTIHLAFLGGTSGNVRNEIVKELRGKISMLRLRLREPSNEGNIPVSLQGSELDKSFEAPDPEKNASNTPQELKRTASESSSAPCCTFSCKPIEKILICYDRIPTNLLLTHVQEFYMAKSSRKSLYRKYGRLHDSNNQALLSRYLHHHRWIWGLQSPSSPAISTNAVMRILNTLTRTRLKEGFRFAYSYNGNITMVKEIKMKLELEESNLRALRKNFDLSDTTSNCIIQYIMFPPHYAYAKDHSAAESDEADSVEADGKPHLITEVWVEPQNGVNSDFHQPLHDKPRESNYKEVAQSFYDLDKDCICSLATFESLMQECEQKTLVSEDPPAKPLYISATPEVKFEGLLHIPSSQDELSPIEEVPYTSNFIGLLNRCLQAEIHLSTLIKDFSGTLLKQNLGRPNNDSLQDKSQANQSFYSFFIDHLNYLHNGQQFQLSQMDSAALPHHLTSRSLLQPQLNGSSLYSHVSSYPKEFVNWRCFMKLISQNHAIFTLLPSTYYDLQLLFAPQNFIRDINSKSFTPFSSRNDIDKILEEIVSIKNEYSFMTADTHQKTKHASLVERKRHQAPLSTNFQQEDISYSNLKTSTSSSNVDDVPPHTRHTVSGSTERWQQESCRNQQEKRTRYASGPALVVEGNGGQFSSDTTQQGNCNSGSRGRANSLQNSTDRRKRNVSMPSTSSTLMSASNDSKQADASRLLAQLCNTSLSPLNGFLTLPLYIYECKLPHVINQLINRNKRESIVGCDVFVDSLFKNDACKEAHSEAQVPQEDDLLSSSYTSHEAATKSPPPEAASPESKTSGKESKLVKNLLDSVERSQRRSFVMGVFEALSKNLFVHSFDVQCALDQCQEIFLEIDITEYMKVICEHMREFNRRTNLELLKLGQMATKPDAQNKKTESSSKEEESPRGGQDTGCNVGDAETEDETCPSKLTSSSSINSLFSFPLLWLSTHKPSQDISYIHKGIRQHFRDILEAHFQPVPGLDDYYYYHPYRVHSSSESQNSQSKVTSVFTKIRSKKKSFKSSLSEDVEDNYYESYAADSSHQCPESDANEGGGAHDDTLECEEDEKDVEFRSDAGSLGYSRFTRQLSQFSQFSGFDDWPTSTVSDEEDGEGTDLSNNSPLFLHLTCTIRSCGQVVATTSINSLPTCLGDISNSIEGSLLNMKDLSITLEILVMTLIGGAPISLSSLSTSTSGGGRIRVFSTGDGKLLCRSISQCSAGQRHSFSDDEEKLPEEESFSEFPEAQSKAIASTFEKIKWLLEDEIISSKLQSLSITEEMLQSITLHIERSLNYSSNCLTESIPLKFVFGMEQSMAEFMQEFENMSMPYYRLEKKGSLYFLVLDRNKQAIQYENEDFEKCQLHFFLPRKRLSPALIPVPGVETQESSNINNDMHGCLEGVTTNPQKQSPPSPDLCRSPRRLQQKVSFEADYNEVSTRYMEISASDKTKKMQNAKQAFKKRLKKRERRDSDRRMPRGPSISCTSSSDSETEARSAPISVTPRQTDFLQESEKEDGFNLPLPEVDKTSSSEKDSIPLVSAIKIGDNVGEKPLHQNQSSEPPPNSTMSEISTNISLLDNLHLTRCDSVNIPHVAPEKKGESIRKSASTDGFASHGLTSHALHFSRMEYMADGSKFVKPHPEWHHCDFSSKSRHSSGGDILKSRNNSGTGSIIGGLFSDASSLFESAYHTTTEEDGCEGDVSDMDEAGIASRGIVCPCQTRLYNGTSQVWGRVPTSPFSLLLPPFWLIVEISQNKVQTYYHRRVDLNSNSGIEEIHTDLVARIKDIIKVVNQRMLLRDLNDRRECNQLLEPETCDDIWSNDNKDAADEEDTNDCLEAQMKFKLGAFSCKTVWSTTLNLHPRISSQGKGTSKGIQTLRKVLNHLAVNKRKNMFVYEDSSGSGNIFYIKLVEQHSTLNSVYQDSCRKEDSIGGISRSSSIPSLGKKSSVGKEEEILSVFSQEIRPRVSSFGEKDVIVEGVVAMSHQKKASDCVLVTVHGIAEPGPAIKEDLINLLRNKLDEAVLDSICQLPWNNPHHKLTPDDVRFIQPLFEPPTNTYRFSVNAFALPYLEPFCFYLRQNLLSCGFIIPKYTDPRSHRFQDCFTSTESDSRIETPTSPSESSDNSVISSTSIFLFVSSQKRAGSNLVACVAFSLVDSSGSLIHPSLASLGSSTEALSDVSSLDASKFCSLTSTEHVECDQNDKPDTSAILQFKVWEKGRMEMDKCLYENIRHALWDLTMEMHFLNVPICLPCSKSDSNGPQASNEEMVAVSSHIKNAEKSSGPSPPRGILSNKGFAPSVTSSPSCKSFDTHGKVGDGGTAKSASPFKIPRHASLDYGIENASMKESTTEDSESRGQNGTAIPRKLHPFYSKVFTHWLEFGLGINVPAVKKYTFSVANRDAFPVFVTELQKWAESNKYSSFLFQENSSKDENKSSSEFTQVFSTKSYKDYAEEVCPEIPNLIMISWSGTSRVASSFSLSEAPADTIDLQGGKSKYQSKMFRQSAFTDHESGGLSVGTQQQPISPSFVSPLSTSLSIKSSPVPGSVDSFSSNFGAPRQKMLLTTFQGKEVNVYFYPYNWVKDPCDLLNQTLIRLSQWTCARAALLSSLSLQKLGLFHNQPFVRKPKGGPLTQTNPFMSNVAHVKGLIRSSLPARETMESSSKKNEASKRSLSELYRDASSPKNLKKVCPAQSSKCDLVTQHGMQMADISKQHHLQKNERTYLLMILNRNSGFSPSSSINNNTLGLFKKNARIVHFCYTPLLFLPRWRGEVAETRDHLFHEFNESDKPKMLDESIRSRHSSGSNLKGSAGSGVVSISPHLEVRRVSSSGIVPSSSSGSKTSTVSQPRQQEDKWHDTLCLSYLKEYIQYLQCIGYTRVSVLRLPPHGTRSHSKEKDDQHSQKVQEEDISKPTFFMKNGIGGTILVELCFKEPFFFAKVYALEVSRFLTQHSASRSIVPNTFLDSIEVLKVLLHMHSFTYDYHLRAVCAYVANRQLLFPSGYHLSSFLSDFKKYYYKGPSYARNLIYAGDICISDTGTTGEQLYNYLLAREKKYDLKVLRMVPVMATASSDVKTEFVLVHTNEFPFIPEDLMEFEFGDYEVTLLVSHDTVPIQDADQPPKDDPHTLRLKIYVILTNTRNMYPDNSGLDQKGRFRTVSTALSVDHLRSGSITESDPSQASSSHTPSQPPQTEGVGGGTTDGETSLSSFGSVSSAAVRARIAPVYQLRRNTTSADRDSIVSTSHINIREGQEFVNYLGYYSSYEVGLQQALSYQVQECTNMIMDIFNKAKIHCRRDMLWQKMMSCLKDEDKSKSKDLQGSSCLNFNEFTELLKLVNLFDVSDLDEQLSPLVSKPIHWYQSLARLLTAKYQDYTKTLSSGDGNLHYVMVFSPSSPEACMLLTMDLNKQRGTLCCVQKTLAPNVSIFDEEEGIETFQLDPKSRTLLEDVINCACFHLWSSLLN